MTADAQGISYGSSFYWGSTNAPSQLAGLIDLSLGGFDVNQIKSSSLDQIDKWITYMNGMIDPGDMTIKLVYAKSVITTIIASLGVNPAYYWKIVLPDTGTLTGRGNMKKYVP